MLGMQNWKCNEIKSISLIVIKSIDQVIILTDLLPSLSLAVFLSPSFDATR